MVVLVVIPTIIGFFLYYLLHIQLPPKHKYSFGVKLICRTATVGERLGLLLSHFGVSRWKVLRAKVPPVSPPSGIRIKKGVIGGVECSLFYPSDFESRTTPQSAMIFFHGGGWTICSVDVYRDFIYHCVKTLNTLVIAPEYRLAPEHPFPIPYQDCLNVTQEFVKECATYNVDRKKIVLSGDSAGGNLSVAIALKTEVRMVALVYPSLQFSNLHLPSYLENRNYAILPLDFMTRFFLSYMGLDHVQELLRPLQNNEHTREFVDPEKEMAHQRVHPSDIPNYSPPSTLSFSSRERKAMDKYREHIQNLITDSRMSPLTATDDQMMKLPTTYVLTCQNDILRDDGILLVKRLKRLKKEVYHLNMENGFHAIVHAAVVTKDKELIESFQPMFTKIKEVLDQ